MRLPAKFLPKQSQHIGNAVGALAIVVMGFWVMASYLPEKRPEGHVSFGEWLRTSGVQIPFLVVAIAVVLFGLVALAIALVNLTGGSPFSHFTVDRFGLRIRTFFGERQFSWKELGPIRPMRLSVMRAYGLDRRFWIVSDTFSGEQRIDTHRPLSTFNLRIPVTSYLGSSWLGGNVGPAMDATAEWLESLRKLAHAESLDPDNVPEAPEALGPGLPVERPAVDTTAAPPTAPASDLPAMADRKFGRRDGSTVER
jgi:uncharacterized membrane protein YhdT